MEWLIIIILGFGMEFKPDALPDMFEGADEYTTEDMYISCVAAKSMGAALGTTTFFKKFEIGIETKSMHAHLTAQHVVQVAEHVHANALKTRPKFLRILRYGLYQKKLKKQLKRYCS